MQSIFELEKSQAEIVIPKDDLLKDFPYMQQAVLVLIANKELREKEEKDGQWEDVKWKKWKILTFQK